MPLPPAKKAVLYARLSVSTEESVSIERQLESARKACEAQNWEVVGEYRDDGVSASRFKPQDRAGWQALLRSPEPFEVVMVWVRLFCRGRVDRCFA